MSVENVKVTFIRSKGYNNLEEWIDDSENIYILEELALYL